MRKKLIPCRFIDGSPSWNRDSVIHAENPFGPSIGGTQRIDVGLIWDGLRPVFERLSVNDRDDLIARIMERYGSSDWKQDASGASAPIGDSRRALDRANRARDMGTKIDALNQANAAFWRERLAG